MTKRATRKSNKIRTLTAMIFAPLVALFPAPSAIPDAYAQCPPLTSHVCEPETSHPQNYSINQGNIYWAVVGVIPTSPDDKDIYLYPICGAGTPLAASTGVNGTDFVVGDFNHNPLGVYYPMALYGDPSAFYNVYWRNGGAVLPVSALVYGEIGGSGAGCDMIQIYDVYLEAGVEYKITLNPAAALPGRVALFRNPSTGAFWSGRSGSVFEAPGATPVYYAAPATDWYGLVVFPTWNVTTNEAYTVEVEKLDDCIPMEAGTCVNNKLYSVAAGPADEYRFIQEVGWWAAVAVLPDTLDEKSLSLSTGCDGTGTHLASSCGVTTSDAGIIVGDFNHSPFGDYYPHLSGGDISRDFTIQWDSGADLLSAPGEVWGYMSGTTGDCKIVQIWDLYLQAGVEYEFFFYEWGQKDPHLALFRNPGTGQFFVGRTGSEFEMAGTGFRNYTAPQTDYYGLVVFADERKDHSSLYQVQVQPLNDCDPLISGVCEEYGGWPRDFEVQFTDVYWSAVAVCPSEGDSKGLSMFTQCDAKGTNLAYSPSSETCLIVGDFNHTPTGSYYATVSNNSQDLFYTIEAETNPEILGFNTVVSGQVGSGVDCGLVRMWDVFLDAGITYQIGFTESGPADVRLALFRNPGNGTYWADRSMAEWELMESGNTSYTAPASDWYGVVAFATRRNQSGTYTIAISVEGATGIDPEGILPEKFALYQNVPNPFNPSTLIAYDVPGGGGHVTLTIYDVSGRVVRTLVDGEGTPGKQSVLWNGQDDRGNVVSAGVYFYRLTAPGYMDTRKMVYMK